MARPLRTPADRGCARLSKSRFARLHSSAWNSALGGEFEFGKAYQILRRIVGAFCLGHGLEATPGAVLYLAVHATGGDMRLDVLRLSEAWKPRTKSAQTCSEKCSIVLSPFLDMSFC